MLICLVYFEVFQTISSRILCLLCWCVFRVRYGTVSNSFHRIWGHSIVRMGKTSKVLFLHTFHVYQPGGEADWYTLDQVHLDRMFLILLAGVSPACFSGMLLFCPCMMLVGEMAGMTCPCLLVRVRDKKVELFHFGIFHPNSPNNEVCSRVFST